MDHRGYHEGSDDVTESALALEVSLAASASLLLGATTRGPLHMQTSAKSSYLQQRLRLLCLRTENAERARAKAKEKERVNICASIVASPLEKAIPSSCCRCSDSDFIVESTFTNALECECYVAEAASSLR